MHIVGGCSSEQMRGTYTSLYVAVMTDKEIFGDRPVSEFIGVSVSALVCKVTITRWIKTTSP
jgi:hypothetical protein